MELLPKRKSLEFITLSVLVLTVLFASVGSADLRKAKVGDAMPEFSLPDSTGTALAYKHGNGKVMVLTFLPTIQNRYERVVADIQAVVENMPKEASGFAFAGIISGSAGQDLLKSHKPGSKLGFPILLDSQYHLWGTLGVIAAPTVLIVGKDDTIVWIKAGEGADFVPVVRANLNKALGIAPETATEDAQRVKAAVNDTPEARLQRHLQMARILEQKGRFDAAIAEVQKAASLDPNSIEPALALGELFCKSGRNKEALELAEKVKAVRQTEKARLLLISGWARRLMGEIEPAEKLLLEATSLDPQYPRALFELGKVYQAQSKTDKAMECYFKALTLVFDSSGEVKVSKTPRRQDQDSQN